MALNKLMHPRNPYKDRKPNFKELSEKYEQFREHATVDDRGTVHIDFKKPECLKALSWALLKEDFNLDVLMPLDRLIPTVPLRVNYILWLEDILGRSLDLRGIDIGTGASCVYAMLGARLAGWSFLATEADPTNFSYATKNVEQNNLQEKITVRHVTEGSSLYDILTDPDTSYDFCMCNPPFFGSNFEAWGMLSSRTTERPEPSSVSTASPIEMIVPGGEVEFVKRMISDSAQLQDRIRVYTTMLGKKSSLAVLKDELKRSGITHVGTTEFCQGKTMRWGLGWSYCDNITFPKPPTKVNKSQKAKAPLVLPLPAGGRWTEKSAYSVGGATNCILELLEGLQMEVEKTSNADEFKVTAVKNTWSHQRRKRRQQQRKSESGQGQGETGQGQGETGQGQGDTNKQNGTSSESAEQPQNKNIDDENVKETSVGEPPEKIQKLDADTKLPTIPATATPATGIMQSGDSRNDSLKESPTQEVTDRKSDHDIASGSGDGSDSACILSCLMSVSERDGVVTLLITNTETGRDLIHQVLQYLKNKLI